MSGLPQKKFRDHEIQRRGLEGVRVIKEGFSEGVSLQLNPKGQQKFVRQRKQNGQR